MSSMCMSMYVHSLNKDITSHSHRTTAAASSHNPATSHSACVTFSHSPDGATNWSVASAFSSCLSGTHQVAHIRYSSFVFDVSISIQAKSVKKKTLFDTKVARTTQIAKTRSTQGTLSSLVYLLEGRFWSLWDRSLLKTELCSACIVTMGTLGLAVSSATLALRQKQTTAASETLSVHTTGCGADKQAVFACKQIIRVW